MSRLLFSDTTGLIEKFSEVTSDSDSEEKKEWKHKKEVAAWHDDDDDMDVRSVLKVQGRNLPDGGVNEKSGQYSDLVKHKYKLLVGTPDWANLHRKFEEDSDDEILQSVGHIVKTSSISLPKGALEFKRLKYLNQETGTEGPIIQAIEFHPTSSVALVAGHSGVASLLTVDGKKNEKLHSIAFKKFPIYCARFSKDGSEAYLGSNVPYFYVYDLMNAKALRIPLPKDVTKMSMFELSPCGKYLAIGGRFGEIHLICAKSRESIQTLKQSGDVTAIAFSPDSTKLYGHGSEGLVTVWDMSTLKVIHKWVDDGCLSGSSLAISPSGNFFATGSAQGVVNIYETKDILYSKAPKPQKIILNLTTSITSLKFNPSSEILAILSSEASNAVRLVHIPSFQVFSNFPGIAPNLGHCSVINFSPNSGYMSFGNNKRLAYLYRLKHFKNY